MNLTNDNHVGCQQIASCGGLETMCSLIANHFPSFCSTSSNSNELKVHTLSLEFEFQNEKHLTDQELDFLVAILGLLVNLVEKDGHNRSVLLQFLMQQFSVLIHKIFTKIHWVLHPFSSFSNIVCLMFKFIVHYYLTRMTVVPLIISTCIALLECYCI